MPVEIAPEAVLTHLKEGRLKPVYLFYGPDDFNLEKILKQIRETFIPESARDLNSQVFDGTGVSARVISLMPPGRCRFYLQTVSSLSGARTTWLLLI